MIIAGLENCLISLGELVLGVFSLYAVLRVVIYYVDRRTRR